ncbi:MAG TPA: LPP20 family lipoprotein [Chromobacteriaceae bacterium]|nr:LPP20 family lipoprotein [Chromobacteriaceae bacterium]
MKACSARLASVVLLLGLSACATAEKPPVYTSESPIAPVERTDLAVTGVGYAGPGIEPEAAPKVVVKEVNPYQPVTIRVTGNGAAPYSRSLTPSQRKLLALRAARLDAFRAIAEQVQGMKLVGNSSVSNMIATNDGFRTYVDAFLRGVRIVSTTMQPDGTSEAVAEIVLDQDFYKQYKNALEKTGSVMKAAQQNATVGVECAETNCGATRYSSNYYVAH